MRLGGMRGESVSLYAVFHNGEPIWQTLDPSYALAMAASEAMYGKHWTELEDEGYDVHRVKIIKWTND